MLILPFLSSPKTWHAIDVRLQFCSGYDVAVLHWGPLFDADQEMAGSSAENELKSSSLSQRLLMHKARKDGFKVTYILMTYIYSRETYNALTNWLTDARTLASPNIVIILVGNKKDLEAEREVTFLEASRFAQENGTTLFYNYLMSTNFHYQSSL